jgi:hypothetical protein
LQLHATNDHPTARNTKRPSNCREPEGWRRVGNLSAVLSPNIYVTGCDGSTKRSQGSDRDDFAARNLGQRNCHAGRHRGFCRSFRLQRAGGSRPLYESRKQLHPDFQPWL